MKYFIDTEYDWNANEGQLVPISIGIVAEDGRDYYAVTTAFAPRYCSPFVQEYVLPVLSGYNGPGGDFDQQSITEIATEIVAFIGDDTPEFWGDYAAFDYVVLSMLIGDFARWPRNWPMHINDLQQSGISSESSEIPHNALADALEVRRAYQVANPP